MPADDRLWPEDCNRAEDGREPTIEPNKQEAIGIAELWSLRYLSAIAAVSSLEPILIRLVENGATNSLKRKKSSATIASDVT
jgi:hypothetical protein